MPTPSSAVEDASRTMSSLWGVLPDDVRRRVRSLPADTLARIEEIRIRVNQPIQLLGGGFDGYLSDAGALVPDPEDAWVATNTLVDHVVQLATQASLYAVEEQLRLGYVTIPGGHRVGIAGRAVVTEGHAVKTVRSISSLNIRVAREWIGASGRIRQHIVHPIRNELLSVLVLSPPGCGKTTLLRDLTRQCSTGEIARGASGLKVAVIDERSEIAGMVNGLPQFTLGPKTDVLDGCPKAEGMMMAIRSLSPDVVVTDEIGRRDDVDAVLEALNAGVTVIASAHARSLDEWRKRPYMQALFESQSFSRYVVLSRRSGPCTVEQVHAADGKRLV